MSRILVTGASGFIGRHLVPALESAGHEVVARSSRDGDVASAATWLAAPPAEVIVHLAGRSFVPDSWATPARYLETNVLGTVQALEHARRHGARLVHLSSYLYGAPDHLPIPESAPLVATNPYALSKKLAEEVCRFHAEAYGVPVTVLRPFNVYGPGQADAFLVPSVLRQLRGGVEIRVKDLEPRRDYVYVHDVTAAIVRALDVREGYNVFNVGTGRSFSVRELIDTMQEVWRTQLPVVSEEVRRQDEIMDTVADVSEAKRRIGWVPRFGLREGLLNLRTAS